MSSDTLAARREARRRKILDNAKNRLTKIVGNDKFDTKYEENEEIEENGTILPSKSSTHIGNGVTYTYTDPSEEAFTNDQLHEFSSKLNENIDRFLRDIETNRPTSDDLTDNLITEKEEEKINNTKANRVSQLTYYLLLACLALAVRLMFAFNMGHLISNSMLVPFILIIVARLFLTRKQPTPTGLLTTALLLSGISPQKISFLSDTFIIINQVSVEFSLYLFTFIVVHASIEELQTR